MTAPPPAPESTASESADYGWLHRVLSRAVEVEPHEARAVAVAFVCHFVLFAAYYILRPVRDTMSTVFGVDQLQNLFTGTFFIAMICAPIYSSIAARAKLQHLLPGVFWLMVVCIVIFYGLFETMPQNRWVAASFYWWFSVMNLIIISVFWTLMTDTFTDAQAKRLFPFIQAGSSTGAILGPIITKVFVGIIGVGGLLLVAAAGFLLIVALVHMVMREKARLRAHGGDSQRTTLDHALPGNPFRGFKLLFSSPFMMGQAAFMVLMTWIATFLVFMQVDLISKAYTDLESRTVAFADVDLYVNLATLAVLIFGLRGFVHRFGVTASLVLTPVIMIAACAGIAVAPTLVMVQTARGIQRVTQYAIARTSREMLFTVIDQESRYKAKNVIDTVVYRLGDLTAAWMQTGLRAMGISIVPAVGIAISVSALWAGVSWGLGRSYERLRAKQAED